MKINNRQMIERSMNRSIDESIDPSTSEKKKKKIPTLPGVPAPVVGGVLQTSWKRFRCTGVRRERFRKF